MPSAVEEGVTTTPTVSLTLHRSVSRVQGAVSIDGTSKQDLTYIEVEGRKRAMKHPDFLKKNVPGHEDAIIVGTAHLGIRETRRSSATTY